MMFSRQKYIFIFSLVLMMSYGCGFMPLQNTNTKINFTIAKDLPKSFKAKILAIPNHEESSKLEVAVNSYDFKKYEVFGGVSIMQMNLQAFGLSIPGQFFNMAPYLATMIVLVIISSNKFYFV